MNCMVSCFVSPGLDDILLDDDEPSPVIEISNPFCADADEKVSITSPMISSVWDVAYPVNVVLVFCFVRFVAVIASSKIASIPKIENVLFFIY